MNQTEPVMWRVTHYNGRIYIPHMARTEAGWTMAVAPVESADPAMMSEALSAILRAIEPGVRTVPTPPPLELAAMRNPVVLEIGEKAVKTASTWAIVREADRYEVWRLVSKLGMVYQDPEWKPPVHDGNIHGAAKALIAAIASTPPKRKRGNSST